MMKIKKIIFLLPILLIILSCSGDDETIAQEEIQLQEVTFEVIQFEFTSDTGNNTSRLQYEIKFSNPNDTAINGFHKVTINTDGLISSNIATNRSPCYLIEANSDCIVNFDKEQSFDFGIINSIELVSVEYNLRID